MLDTAGQRLLGIAIFWLSACSHAHSLVFDRVRLLGQAAQCMWQGKEETFDFLQTVLTEVIDLFPGTFIHIGGDEVGHLSLCQAPIASAPAAGHHMHVGARLQSQGLTLPRCPTDLRMALNLADCILEQL